jgi:hypothetical protein
MKIITMDTVQSTRQQLRKFFFRKLSYAHLLGCSSWAQVNVEPIPSAQLSQFTYIFHVLVSKNKKNNTKKENSICACDDVLYVQCEV